MKVVGIDLSLTNSGLVVFEDGSVKIVSIPSKPTGKSISDRLNRITDIVNTIRTYLCDSDLVVIEAPAYAKNVGSSHERSGLWWMVANVANEESDKVVEIPPTCRAKYGSSRGNAGKDEVLLAVARRYPEYEVKNNDEADALLLMAIGCRLLGSPIEQDLPASHLEALKKVSLNG